MKAIHNWSVLSINIVLNYSHYFEQQIGFTYKEMFIRVQPENNCLAIIERLLNSIRNCYKSTTSMYDYKLLMEVFCNTCTANCFKADPWI